MEDRLAHDVEHRPGLFHRGGLAAADEGERPGTGAAHAAGDRGVHERQSRRRGTLGDTAGLLRGDGGAVHQEGVAGDARDQPVVPLVDLTDVASGREHGDDDLGTVGGGHGGLRLRRAGLHQGAHRFRHQVEDRDLVAGIDEVRGHGGTHVAQADECDP